MSKVKSTENEFSSRLIIRRKRRVVLVFFSILCFLAFLYVISSDHMAGISWLSTSLSVILIGAGLLVIPLTEEWEYTPWQTESQRYERTILD